MCLASMSMRMDCLLKYFQFGPEFNLVSEYGDDASGDIAAAIPTWCRSDVCVAVLRAPVSDAKLARPPSAFTCFGQQISVSVQPSIQGTVEPAQGSITCATAGRLQRPHCRPEPNAAAKDKAALKQAHQQQKQQQQQALHAAFYPAASVDNVALTSRLVLGRPLDPVLDLGGQRCRAGLGHSAPTLMDLDPQQSKSVAQVNSGALLPPAAACMKATDGPSTSAVPAAVADPTFAAGPTPADTPMLPVVPLSVPPEYPDTAVSSAMCFGQRMLTYLLTLPGKQSSMCMPNLHQSSASIPQQTEQ